MSEIISSKYGEKISLSKGDLINLSKMPAIDLSKGGHGLSKVTIGLGWDPAKKAANTEKKKNGFFGFFRSFLSLNDEEVQDIDCDAFAIKLKNGKMESSKDLICYFNLSDKNKSVYHTGDNLTGEGEGDDEQIVIDLNKVDCDSILLAVCIYKGRYRGQDFGMLENAYIRIVDNTNNMEMCRFDLDEAYNNYVTVTFGELVKINNEWSFKAVGEAVDKDNIESYANIYGYTE